MEPVGPSTRNGTSLTSAFMVRKPFKLFCEFEKQIRASIAELEIQGGREILISKTHSEHKPVAVDGFAIDCYNLGFDGSSFGPKFTLFYIRKFQGTRIITSLAVFPLRLDPTHEAIEKDIVDRGSRYLELTKLPYAHKLLTGTTLDEPAEEIDAQIIVDTTFAINRNPQWNQDMDYSSFSLTEGDSRETQAPPYCTHTNDTVQKDLEMDKSKVEEYIQTNAHALRLFPASDLAAKDRILLPHWAYGFVLRSRQPSGHKEIVKALVRNHARSSTNSIAISSLGASMDLVRGKGKGLIILLHGEPGVGKTSTAECVADLIERPLFPVTCGDIGETAAEVQNSLDKNFQLAYKWGCVLFLDEADVFMAKRNKTDLRRNAVVSVFLRTLEYYSGILFLTTNRVGSIDPAFKSRIHMSLFYPHLGLDATLQLYKILLDRTLAEQKASKKVDFKVKSKEIMSFAKSHYKRLTKEGLITWNGRQIRNAFQIAITLAEYSSPSKEFDLYMKDTLGATDADLARREDIRYDRFGGYDTSNTPAFGSTRSREGNLRPAGRNSKDPESESESEESFDMDNEEDGDDNDEEKETLPRVGDTYSATAKDKHVVVGSSKGQSATGSSQVQMAEFEEFLRFQEMKKKRGKY
ncbi:P-loop containing nucleoside triphosphate hydrolase protein [Leptodontidium sp. MPI-SDFR-AT-0119]|nr:P-loop containing nucleoside triphosphate hydrolase protein [Leptodontidium sp. MPI-SDFR-AT-0119]